jgi:hypothetical protein
VSETFGENADLESDEAEKRDNAGESDRLSALARLCEADGTFDTDEIAGPVFWTELSPGEATQEWATLRAWVEQLMARFSHLDHHAIPRCWFLHNGHVEALAALRDQERINYGESAPGTAAVDWHRAFRDIEARLRDWTGQLACGATHELRSRHSGAIDPGEWDKFVHDDASLRDRHAIERALED